MSILAAKMIKEGYPLSPEQKHIFGLLRDEPRADFSASIVAQLDGKVSAEVMEQAVSRVAERHEILRTGFYSFDGLSTPVQVIAESVAPGIFHRDLEAIDEVEIAEQLVDGTCPSDLEQDSLLRITLGRFSENKHLFALSLPALCADNSTLSTFLEETARCYGALMGEKDLLPEPLQYADLAEWRNGLLEAEAGRSHWKKQFADGLTTSPLPFELSNPAPIEFAPKHIRRRISSNLRSAIEQTARDYDSSIPALLLASWYLLLWRLADRRDLIIGIGCDGRKWEELTQSAGPLTRFVPISLSPRSGFNTVLARAHQLMQEAQQWQEYFCWEDIREITSGDCEPFFAYCFEHYRELDTLIAGGLTVQIIHRRAHVDRFRLKLICAEKGEDIELDLHYDPGCFNERDVAQLLANYHALLESAMAEPERDVLRLRIVSPEERKYFLSEMNATESAYPAGMTMIQLFERQVSHTPDRVAVEFVDEQLSYGELNARSNQIARKLRELGVGPERPVAICLERSIAMVAGVLGIFKAGGAYVPIDPADPSERIAHILHDCKAKVLIADRSILIPESDSGNDIFVLSVPDHPPAPVDMANPERSGRPDNLAYVIYTSGSTGKPKGVAVEHRSLLNYIVWAQRRLFDEQIELIPVLTKLTFDASLKQVFTPLITGRRVWLISAETQVDPRKLALELAGRTRVGCNCVPPLWSFILEMLGDSELELLGRSLSRLMLGGESFSSALIEKTRAKFPNVEIWNLYGPTEVTANASAAVILDEPFIGEPVGNATMYLLDDQLELAPLTGRGELFVGGVGLARGYHNSPHLTAERFLPDPFSGTPGSRLYQTGDLARYHSNRNLVILGRADSQVKIRGYRIELGEIEAALCRHPAIRQAAVVAKQDSDEVQLVAYLVPGRTYATTIRGRPLYRLPNDVSITHQNRNETDYLYEEIFLDQAYFQHGVTVEDGACVFDVGANIGIFSLFVQQSCANPRIYAFEPIPPLFEILNTNIELHIPGCKAFQIGLSNKTETASFIYYPMNSMMSGRSAYSDRKGDLEVIRRFISKQLQTGLVETEVLLPSVDEILTNHFDAESFQVNLRTLSDVIQEEGVERIDLLKIDVQRAEWDVLKGIDDSDWDKIRQIVLELHDGKGEPTEGRLGLIVSLLEGRGFEIAWKQEALLKGTDRFIVYARRPVHAKLEERPARTPPPVKSMPRFPAVPELTAFLNESIPDYMLPTAYVVLDELPITPTGKIDRASLASQDVRKGALDGVSLGPRDVIELKLCQVWEDLLSTHPVGVKDDFFQIGGHSLLAVHLIDRVGEVFGQPLPLAALFEEPTVEHLADLLRQASVREPWSPLVPIQPRGSKPPFFCVHPAGGNVFCFVRLAQHLGSDTPFCGLQAVGLEGDRQPLDSIEAMAAEYVTAVKRAQPHGPIMLGGWSMGGVVAFEMACQLQSCGRPVGLLALLDTKAPDSQTEAAQNTIRILSGIAMELGIPLEEFKELGRDEQLARMIDRAKQRSLIPRDFGLTQAHRLYEVFEMNSRAMHSYVPKPYPGKITLLAAAESSADSEDPMLGWGEFARDGVDIHLVPGTHGTMLSSTNVRYVAERLRELLQTVI